MLIRPALVVLLVFCLADWVLIEDLGFLGGLGTDPNSMIPVALLAVGGYLALAPAPQEAAAAVDGSAGRARDCSCTTARWRRRAARACARCSRCGQPPLSSSAPGPMAFAQANPSASPIIAQAIDGNAAPLNFAAPGFTLTDQNGNTVSLASMRGKVVLLTFLDPVCTSDCPLIAQEFKAADKLLGADSGHVELVAVVANPVYHSVAYTRAFDAQEGLSRLPNWLYLTGSPAHAQQAWRNYGIAADPGRGRDDRAQRPAYVIDARGHTRAELNFDPGPGTQSTQSSFAGELAAEARQTMGLA